jgi:glyoxylase-like metal-dependent hydrolase (beta-lactamase superfamily II)
MEEIATGVVRIPVVFVNAYIVESSEGFVVVDTGIRGLGATLIGAAVRDWFGREARPQSIVLTHGHFDHAGSARALSDLWQVPIYAHRLELPYLTGQSDYPPQDPTVGGALANLSRLFPHGGDDFGSRIRALDSDGTVPGLPEWRAIPTPGHTRGHISLFRSSDGVLLAGDALATMDQESVVQTLVQSRQLRWPPAAMTTDWQAAARSLDHLATLQPTTIAAGHGLPLTGPEVAPSLSRFARTFTPPAYGRYVNHPAEADERGVVSLPPPVVDPVSVALRAAAVAGVAGIALLTLQRRRLSLGASVPQSAKGYEEERARERLGNRGPDEISGFGQGA